MSGETRSVQRRRTVAIAVCAIGLAIGAAVVASRRGTGPRPTLSWAALGDSFSSGEGVPPFADGCHRSARAYAPQAAGRLRRSGRRVRLDVRACTGAVVADLSRGQLDAVTSSTNVVTVTIGGNDLGFSDFVLRCAVTACPSIAEARVVGLRVTLTSLYRNIRARAAPGARVLVIGYPHLAAERSNSRRSSCVVRSTAGPSTRPSTVSTPRSPAARPTPVWSSSTRGQPSPAGSSAAPVTRAAGS